jgi:hypothetical protein
MFRRYGLERQENQVEKDARSTEGNKGKQR